METLDPLPDENGTIDPVLVAAGSLQDAVQPERRTRRWSRRRQAEPMAEDFDAASWRPVADLAEDATAGRHVGAARPSTTPRRPGTDPTGGATLEEQLRLTSLALSAAEATTQDAVRDRDAALAARRELTALVAELSAQLEEIHLGRREAEESARMMAESRAASEEELAGRLAVWDSELRAGLVRGAELVERAQQVLSDARVEAGRADALATSAEQARQEQLATLAAVDHLAADAAAAHEARLRAEALAGEQAALHQEAREAAVLAETEATRAREELRTTLDELDERARRAEHLHTRAMTDATAAVQEAAAAMRHQEELLRVTGERERDARRQVETERARASEATAALTSAVEERTEDVRRLEEIIRAAAEAQESRREAELRLVEAERQTAQALAAAASAAEAQTAAHASADEAWRALESHRAEHDERLAQALDLLREQALLVEKLREEVLIQAEARARLMIDSGVAPQPAPAAGRLSWRPRPARGTTQQPPTTSPDVVEPDVPAASAEPQPTSRRAAGEATGTAGALAPAPDPSPEVPAATAATAVPVPAAPAPVTTGTASAVPVSAGTASTVPAAVAATAPSEDTTARQAPESAPAASPTSTPVVRRRKGGTTIELVGGVLYIWRRKSHHIFDLTSRAGQIEVVGVAGQRGWRVLFHRRGLDPVVLTGSDVDAAWMTDLLGRYDIS